MDKKSTILQAALSILVERGIHATPVSLIAKKANTGMGTIYNYFESKEVLINAIYVDIKNKEERILKNALDNTVPIRIQFEKYYSIIVDFYLHNPSYFRFLEQVIASPIITQNSKNIGYNAVANITTLIELGKTEHIIKNIPTVELLQFLSGTVIAYVRWLLQQENAFDYKNTSFPNQTHMVWDSVKA